LPRGFKHDEAYLNVTQPVWRYFMMKRFGISTFAMAVIGLIVMGRDARADIVYQANGFEPNYIPFGEDGVSGRPVPGDMLGNTITLAGDSRSLDRITIDVALNNAGGSPDPALDTWTVDLYLNDGPDDAKSGLMQPGTLIASASTDVAMPPFNPTVVFDFTAGGIVVPDTFTVVISSTHPVDTFFQSPGVAGPFSSRTAPIVGSGTNTLWYNTDASAGFETNSTWAIRDGATTNFMFMKVEASP
jgi:hypothetical protein